MSTHSFCGTREVKKTVSVEAKNITKISSCVQNKKSKACCSKCKNKGK